MSDPWFRPQDYERLGKVGAWAPGSYMNHCCHCGKEFIGDKRAQSCLPCQVNQLLSANSRVAELEAEVERLREALERFAQLARACDDQDLWLNPDALIEAANEIDCDFQQCDCVTHEWDTNFSMCTKADAGEYCPNAVAETLRAIAKVPHVFYGDIQRLTRKDQPDE